MPIKSREKVSRTSSTYRQKKMIALIKDTLKAFDNFKNKQKNAGLEISTGHRTKSNVKAVMSDAKTPFT